MTRKNQNGRRNQNRSRSRENRSRSVNRSYTKQREQEVRAEAERNARRRKYNRSSQKKYRRETDNEGSIWPWKVKKLCLSTSSGPDLTSSESDRVRFSSERCPRCNQTSWYSTSDDPHIKEMSRFEIMIPDDDLREEVKENLSHVCFNSNCGKSEPKENIARERITQIKFSEYMRC